MIRFLAVTLGLCFFVGCNGDKQQEAKPSSNVAAGFKTVGAYQLTEADLLANADTTTINGAFIKPLITDSATAAFLNKAKAIRYVSLAKVKGSNGQAMLIVKAVLPLKAAAAAKNAALVITLDAKEEPKAAMLLLLPDSDPTTSQTASVDKNLTVTKTITRRENNEVVGEGKEVWAFDAKANGFSLVVLDPLDDDASASRNPIDTFPRTTRFAGDYLLGKKGLVSVRDGRHPSQLLVYIHTEDAGGECTGQMKGEFTMTSTTTAAFRQGGDPCVLNLSFKGATVSIAEQSGCGNYRGLDCPFSGTFTKKKVTAPKPATTKSRRR